MENKINKIRIEDHTGATEFEINLERLETATVKDGILTVAKKEPQLELELPDKVKRWNYSQLLTEKGFRVITEMPGKWIEFKDPKTGNCFVAKIGIRKKFFAEFLSERSEEVFDPDTEENAKKKAFIRKYGMIIVPQFCLSLNEKEELCSVSGEKPVTYLNWQQAYDIFSKMRLPEGVFISMMTGFEYELNLTHMLYTKEVKISDVVRATNRFGGYDSSKVYETGKAPSVDGVFNQTGLVRYWTQCNVNGVKKLYAGSCRDSKTKTVSYWEAKKGCYRSNFWSTIGTLYFD